MDIKGLINPAIHNGWPGVAGFFSACGDFGVVDGMDKDFAKIAETQTGYRFENDDFTAECVVEKFENEVFSRRDYFTAKKDLNLNRYTSRFCLECADYDIYTQFSCWKTESSGGWQDLVTGVETFNLGIRTTEGATPMMAVRNKNNGRILVLHLLPNANWKMRIVKCPVYDKDTRVIIETGINDKGLNLKVAGGETVEMPRLFVFEAKSAIDFDAWKLHTVYNRLYPRRQLPVMYNTWLNCYDPIDADDVMAQAKAAAELGVEQFLIDAGWFGRTDKWYDEIGNWFENMTGGYKGRVKELSAYVRELGMKFGMWLEPERALKTSDAYKAHPDYFIDGAYNDAFLDFANDDARKYITEITLGLIRKYDLQFMKLDFNAPLAYDETGTGFYRYFKGTKQFIADIKAEYPDLYLTNCASGGNRMDLENGMIYDSIWSSDNQSPIYGFRIFKDTALRMPPCHIEKWDVRLFVGDFPRCGKMPVCMDGESWGMVRNVSRNYTYCFLTGGPIGFSTDIAGYPQEEKDILKKHIERFKSDREFYRTANMRILHQAENITVLQYSDTDFNRIIIQAFSNVPNQEYVTVYPALSAKKSYSYYGDLLSGEDMMKRGVPMRVSDIDCTALELTAVKN